MAAVSAVLVLDHYLRHHGQQETNLEAERFSAATRERDRESSTRCLVRLFAALLSCEEPRWLAIGISHEPASSFYCEF